MATEALNFWCTEEKKCMQHFFTCLGKELSYRLIVNLLSNLLRPPMLLRAVIDITPWQPSVGQGLHQCLMKKTIKLFSWYTKQSW